MKPLTRLISSLTLPLLTIAGLEAQDDVQPALASIGPIAFAPKHQLLVSDPSTFTVWSFDVGKHKGDGMTENDSVTGIQAKLAGMVGTERRQVRVIDVAVDPETGQAWLAVLRGRDAGATPLVFRVGAGGKISAVELEGLESTHATIPHGERKADDATSSRRRRRRSRRSESITDLAYVNGKVVVAGLSNEEFASRLRVLLFPFEKADKGTSVEIWHGAHGRFETHAPVRTFAPIKVGDTNQLLAAYTCTPLVMIPVSALVPGKHIKGRTVAELGNRNNPLDMIVYGKGGDEFLLMANSSRGVMKIPTKGLAESNVTERITGGKTAGVVYETIKDLAGVMQLAKLDESHGLILARGEDGGLDLRVIKLP